MTNKLNPFLLACCAFVVLLLAAVLRLEAITQFPAGVSRDEAVNVVNAHHSAMSGVLPFFEDFEEPEPLYRIVLSLAAHFTGGTVAIDRTVSAFVGILTVAAAYWTTLQCLYDLPREARHLGALAAGIALTIALGHITLSRSLYRGILQPPFMLMTLGFVMRGLRSLRWADFIVAGVFLGGTIYTYTSAYVTPFAFIIMQISLTLFRPRQIQRWMPRLVTTAIVALVVLLPFTYRLATNSQSILARSGDVTNSQFNFTRAVYGMVAQLLVAGDENPQYNVYEQPVISQATQPFFIVGLLALLLRFRNPASLYLIVLGVLVSVPALLGNELTHGLRIVGWYAIFPIICGIGVGTLAYLILRWTKRKWILGVSAVLLCFGAIILTIQARTLYQSYWRDADVIRLWKMYDRELNHSEWFFRTDAQELVRWINNQDVPILLPAEYANQFFVRAWLIEQFPNVTTATSYNSVSDNAQLLIPRALGMEATLRSTRHFVLLDGNTLTLLPPLDKQTHTQILSQAPTLSLDAFGHFDSLGDVYAMPSQLAVDAIDVEGIVAFSDDLGLQGVSHPANLVEGENTFTLYWNALRQPIGHDYMGYLQIQDQNFKLIAGHDERIWRALYPTSLWHSEDRVPQGIVLNVPSLPIGAYRLVVGVYPPFGKQLPATYNNGATSLNGATVAWLKVPSPSITIPDDLQAINAVFADTFELVGATYRQNENIQLTLQLVWRSLKSRPAIDATLFVHLLDRDGQIVSQQDTRPQNGGYPTFIWEEGEIVMTEHILDMDTLSIAETRFRVGMYTLPEVQNLSVTQNGQALSEPFVLFGLTNR